MKAHDIVYYDGQCSICTKEMNKLKQENHEVDIYDIHQLSIDQDKSTGLDKETMLSRLHVFTQEGVWLVGARANLYLWRNTKFGKWLKILNYQPFYSVVWLGYELWLLYYNFKKKTGNDERLPS